MSAVLTTWLNIVGLCLDIVGVFIIFFTGFPPVVVPDSEGAYYATEPTAKEKKRMVLYSTISRIGLGLVLTGFVLQLASNALQLCAG